MKNGSVKKSLEKSKNEKRKNSHAKNLQKKYQRVYNNCYELRSRAIKKPNGQTKKIGQKVGSKKIA